MLFITFSSDYFVDLAATIYDFVVKLYYFLFEYNLVGGQTQLIKYENPFNYTKVSYYLPVFDKLNFLVNSIENLFKIDLTITPFGLIFGFGIFFILGYSVIKYLIPQ